MPVRPDVAAQFRRVDVALTRRPAAVGSVDQARQAWEQMKAEIE
jgi:hypothetical protein